MNHEESQFRIGASHAAEWLRAEAQQLVSEGQPAEKISNHLGDLVMVLLDWRESNKEMPSGNPWEWPRATLVRYISDHQDE